MFIQFIHANDLRPLFVLVVRFFQCLGLWNSGGKKSPTPNPPIAVLYGTWWFAPESLPYHQQNELRSCEPKRRVSSLRILPISGAPTFLAPLDGACRVSAPPSERNGQNQHPVKILVGEEISVSQYHKCDPYRANNHPKNVWKEIFQPGLLKNYLVARVPVIRRRQSGSKMTDIFEFNDNEIEGLHS